MPVDLRGLSDGELVIYVLNIRAQVVALEAQLKGIPSSRQRTIKVIRATFLTTGGIFAGAVDPIGFLLAAVGLWDWVVTLSDDAQAMNAQISLNRELNDLEAQLKAAEAEVQRRNDTSLS